MELTVLGCGDAFGNDGRNNTSYLLTEGEEHVLVDCGTTTLIQLKKEKINLEEISTILISHFHGDHYGGLPFFLICALFEQPRKQPLTIAGPKGIEERVMTLQDAMYAGTAEKLSGLSLEFVEYVAGEPVGTGDKVITAYEVEHSPPSSPHGVRVEWNGKTFAFSGDTSWTDKLIPLSKEADLFICECNFLKGVNFGHLSYEELQEKHQLFDCRQLWLSHMADEVIYAKDFRFNRLKDGQKITF